MKAVIQRVSRARVLIGGDEYSSIGPGMLVLLGVERQDTAALAVALARKITELRIFDDAAGKMNLSVRDINGQVLIVSQFTLLGDCRRGRRPSFDNAAAPAEASALYEEFVNQTRSLGVPVETGQFRATMDVELT